MAELASHRAGAAWLALAASLVAGASIGWHVERGSIDWQPALFAAEPWRAWTAVFVHYSALHLGANIAGAVLVASLGRAVPVPRRTTLAWLAAWPLTQVGLLWQPALVHYGGLSGVLHAGVAVVVVHLLWSGTLAQQRIGFAMLAVLGLKLLAEAPWQAVLRHPEGWDIAVAPAAHLSGVAAGALCAAAAEALRRSHLEVER